MPRHLSKLTWQDHEFAGNDPVTGLRQVGEPSECRGVVNADGILSVFGERAFRAAELALTKASHGSKPATAPRGAVS